MSDVIGLLGGIALPAVGVMAFYRAPSRLQVQVKNDAEILANLPRESDGHTLLLSHIERRLEVLTRQPRRRRSLRGLVGAVAMLVFALLVVLFGMVTDGWTSVVFLIEAGVTTIIAVAAFVEAVVATERDYRGQRVRQAPRREGSGADVSERQLPALPVEGSVK